MTTQHRITISLIVTPEQHKRLTDTPIGQELDVVVQRRASVFGLFLEVLDVVGDEQHVETQNERTERRLAQSIRAEMLHQQGGPA